MMNWLTYDVSTREDVNAIRTLGIHENRICRERAKIADFRREEAVERLISWRKSK